MRLFAFLLTASVLGAGSVNAAWDTAVEDDIFSGGKKALVVGDINADSFAAADCVTGGGLSFAYAEVGKWNEGYSNIRVRMLLKVDGGPVYDLSAVATERNSTYIQFASNEADIIVPLLKDIAGAKKTILLGIEFIGTGNKHSATIPVAGSSRAVRTFLEACGLD